MPDFKVWFNLTAPYASGVGRRTIFRVHARVDAQSTIHAMMSPNVTAIGTMERMDDHHTVWRLGQNLEVWIHCPTPERPHCKVCGAQGKRSSFCTECSPLAQGGDPVMPEPLARNRLSNGRKALAKTKRVAKPQQPTLSMDEIMAQFNTAKGKTRK
jgi:hypothetical protein